MNTLLDFLIILACITLMCHCDNRKPIWNIAHMVNDRNQIDEFLDLGANAIEVDVQYENSGSIGTSVPNGEVVVGADLYHGFPCDVGRDCHRFDDIAPYLEEIKARATVGNPKYNSKLGLIYFDNKLSSGDDYESAGQNLANAVIKLFPSKIYVMVGVPYTSQWLFFRGFYETIKSQNEQYLNQIGYEFSDEKSTDPDVLGQIFRSIGVVNGSPKYPVWLSKGITNGMATSYDFTNFLEARDSSNSPVSKVYGWTADKQKTMQDWMYKGLDAIITNYPQNLVSVLEYPSLKNTHRLATNADNPLGYFSQIAPHYYGCSMHSNLLYYCWKTCGKYPDSDDWCWTDVRCGDNENICQFADGQKDCSNGQTCDIL